jgi:ubiquinone/menaquinone biosynthesis C-methylase UbiE
MIWEQAYKTSPQSFRHYPNEELIRFIGRHYLSRTTREERQRLEALEVGCGNGSNLWAVAAEGFRAHGLDYAPTALELARATLARWKVSAELRQGDARALPYPDATFDFVFDVGALQCLTFTDLGKAHGEAYRVLKKGGRFFTYHFGRNTWDYDHGGGTFIDRHTVDNTPNPEAIYPNIGTLSMPEVSDMEESLSRAGFRPPFEIETVTKTYANRTKQIEFMVIGCVK